MKKETVISFFAGAGIAWLLMRFVFSDRIKSQRVLNGMLYVLTTGGRKFIVNLQGGVIEKDSASGSEFTETEKLNFIAGSHSYINGEPIEDEDIIIETVPPGNPRSGKLFWRNGKLYVVRKKKVVYQFNKNLPYGRFA